METDRLEALELSKGLTASASNIERVSGKTSPEAAHWAFGQWELRKSAAAKGFPRAEELLYHEIALWQATHFAIARYHASLFPKGELVADLTTGIGSDLIALAERGPVIGFDTDLERLQYARHNLQVLGLEAELVHQDCLNAEWKFEFAIADPSRRADGHSNGYRIVQIEQFLPNPIVIAERMNNLQFGLMKLTPMLNDQVLQGLGARVDFVSFGRECREALIYIGKRLGTREQDTSLNERKYSAYRYGADMSGSHERWTKAQAFAIHVESGEELPESDPPPNIEEPLAFLYEADPAAIRAHGLGVLAKQLDLQGLGDSNGYLSGKEKIDSKWLTGFRVHGYGHFDRKNLRARLSQMGGGTPIVKSRVARVNVVEVRKQLTTKGAGTPIVAIYPVGASLRYAILERL